MWKNRSRTPRGSSNELVAKEKQRPREDKEGEGLLQVQTEPFDPEHDQEGQFFRLVRQLDNEVPIQTYKQNAVSKALESCTVSGWSSRNAS